MHSSSVFPKPRLACVRHSTQLEGTALRRRPWRTCRRPLVRAQARIQEIRAERQKFMFMSLFPLPLPR